MWVIANQYDNSVLIAVINLVRLVKLQQNQFVGNNCPSNLKVSKIYKFVMIICISLYNTDITTLRVRLKNFMPVKAT